MLSNKRRNPVVTELFITGRKLNNYHFFFMQSYFAVPKNVRLNFTHFFHYENCKTNKNQIKSNLIIHQILNLKTVKPYTFLVADATLVSNDSLSVRKNILERTQKLIMKIGDKVRDEKLQYDINREVAKISA